MHCIISYCHKYAFFVLCHFTQNWNLIESQLNCDTCVFWNYATTLISLSSSMLKWTCYCCVLIGLGLVCICLKRNATSYTFSSDHNCHLWLVGGLRVRAETVDKLEACFHGLNLLQQVWGASFFSWRLGGHFRRGGRWGGKVEFCRRSNFLTGGHHRFDYFLTRGQNRCDWCPRSGKASCVLFSSFPLRGWRSGDRICRAGPEKRRGITDWSLKELEWAVF